MTKITGFHPYRLIENDPYHETEVKLNEEFNKLSLNNWEQAIFETEGCGMPKDCLSDREFKIIASTIQWLGTPCGKAFLSECGFKYVGNSSR